MGFTSINDSQARAQTPRSPEEQAARTYLNPPDMINHLLLVWPVRYEAKTITKYPRQDGRDSDAVYADVVDLSVPGEDGYPGKVMRQAKWTQGRLIRDTKGAVGVGRDEPMLVQMTRDGDAYQLIEQAHNPGSVQMAEWWMNAHPHFRPGEDAPVPTVPQPPTMTTGPIRSTPPYPTEYPMPATTTSSSGVWPPSSGPPAVPAAPPAPVNTPAQSEVLARLRAQAEAGNPFAQTQSGPAMPPLPPPPPPAPPMAGFPEDEPPF